jgi:hypothetical protein
MGHYCASYAGARLFNRKEAKAIAEFLTKSRKIKMKTKHLIISTLLVVMGVSTYASEPYPLKTCVVSGEQFGGDLGPPIKIEYNGREVILCCKSCVKKFQREPEKYLSKLDASLTGKK